MFNTSASSLMSEVSSAIPSCSGYNRVGVVVENFGFNKHQTTSSMEPPQMVGSTSTSTVGPIIRSPETEDSSSHSISSFGGQMLKKRFYCMDCGREADDDCEENHTIQRLKKARERIAADELHGLEALLERRVNDLHELNRLNVEAENSIFENYDVFMMLDSEVKEALTQLKDSINSELDATRWEEARQRAQMLLARDCRSMGQDLRDFQKETVSIFVRTSGGNSWLGNNIQVAHHPLLLLSIVQMLHEGTLTEPEDQNEIIDDQEPSEEVEQKDFEGRESSLDIPNEAELIIKEEVEEKPVELQNWQVEIPEACVACSSRHLPEATRAPRQRGRKRVRNLDELSGSLLLQPCGGRGKRLGRNGLHRVKQHTHLNSMFRPALRGVGRRAGVRKIVGLEYDRVLKTAADSSRDSLDLTWLITNRGDENRKKEILRSPHPVRVLTGVYCHKDASFISAVLRKHKDHLEKLVMYAVRREHLFHALDMPRLSKLDVWTCDRPMRSRTPTGMGQLRVRAHRLQWMELNVPRIVVRPLLRAVGGSLQDLLLWVGTASVPSLPGGRDKWPTCCNTLDGLLRQCGPLPRLRTLTLMRNKAWCHFPSACREQMASVRLVLPHVLVRCDVCDVVSQGTSSQGTFSQGSFSQGSFVGQKCEMEDDEDSDSSRPEQFELE